MKKKVELEKRIYVIFFIVTFILVVILILIEWQLARYAINQYEKVNISSEITEFELQYNRKTTTILNDLDNLANDRELQNRIIDNDQDKIFEIVEKNHQDLRSDNLTIIQPDQSLFWGIQWELFDLNLPIIFKNLTFSTSGSYVSGYGNQLFLINYAPIYRTNEEKLLGILMYAEPIDINSFNFEYEVNLIPYKKGLNKAVIPNKIKEHLEKINRMIDEVERDHINKKIVGLSNDFAIGVRILKNLQGDISAVFLVSYVRYVNKFSQKSVVLFILILLAFTLIMIALMGNWFGKTIMSPVKNASKKMQEIANNPAVIEPIEKKYSGVLGDMIDSFNKMNDALNKHSKTLQEYKIITDNIDAGIFWLDNEMNVVLCNPGLLRIIEKHYLAEIKGLNIYKILGYNRKFKFRHNSLTIPNFQIETERGVKFVLLNIRTVKEDKDILYYGSIIDTTQEIRERKAKEALEIELIKSNKLAELGRRVEGIVHNINSPLNSILGYAQLLKKELGDNSDVDRILYAGRNVAKNVKGLLNKIRLGSISMAAPINLNELIEQELELCKHNIFYKHYVKLEKSLQNNLPKLNMVWGDISLCIANIVNNAIDSMKKTEQKVLQVRTFHQDQNVIIEIEDTGEGIEQADIENIFEASFTTKAHKKESGFGLGLAITKNIIEKYQGKIEVSSEVGTGTCFRIILPID